MGGYGSGGGQRQHATVEGCQSLTLDLNAMLRGRPGPALTLAVSFLTREGRQSAMVRFERDAEAGTGTATLAFNIRRAGHETGPQTQTVALRGDPRPFGGRQWFFICPANGGRAVKLHLPTGGKVFMSRRGYRLKYQSQHERPTARAYRRIYAINLRLGHTGAFEAPAEKPPWMRWHTFGRLADRREAAFAFLDGDMIAFIDRLAARDGGGIRQRATD